MEAGSYTKSWGDDSGQSLTASWDEQGHVSVSAPANEGVDRSATLTFGVPDATATLTVNQTGRRELFLTADEGALSATDGDLLTIKEEYL